MPIKNNFLKKKRNKENNKQTKKKCESKTLTPEYHRDSTKNIMICDHHGTSWPVNITPKISKNFRGAVQAVWNVYHVSWLSRVSDPKWKIVHGDNDPQMESLALSACHWTDLISNLITASTSPRQRILNQSVQNCLVVCPPLMEGNHAKRNPLLLSHSLVPSPSACESLSFCIALWASFFLLDGMLPNSRITEESQ